MADTTTSSFVDDYLESETYTVQEYNDATDKAWVAGVEWAIDKLDSLDETFSNMGLTPIRSDVYKELFFYISSHLSDKLEACRDENKIDALNAKIRKLEKRIPVTAD